MSDPIEKILSDTEEKLGRPLTGEEVDAIVEKNLTDAQRQVDDSRRVYINPVIQDN